MLSSLRTQKFILKGIILILALSLFKISQARFVNHNPSPLNEYKLLRTPSCPKLAGIKFKCKNQNRTFLLKNSCTNKHEWIKKATYFCEKQTQQTIQTTNRLTPISNFHSHLHHNEHQHEHNQPGPSPQNIPNYGNFQNSVGHGHQHEIQKVSGPEFRDGFQGPNNNPEHLCNSHDLINLNQNQLTTYLSNQTPECLRYLFNYDDNVANIINQTNFNHINQSITNQLQNQLQISQIQGLVRFIRAALYQEYYQNNLNFTADSKNIAFQNFRNLMNRLNLEINNESQNNLINDIIPAIAISKTYLVLDQYKSILNNYIQNPNQWESYSRNLVIYSILYSIDRSIGVYDQYQRQHYEDQNFINHIDHELITILETYANNQDLYNFENRSYLTENAIWILGHLSTFNQLGLHNRIIANLTNLLDVFPELSAGYLRLVTTFDHYNNCQTSDPNRNLCKEDIIPAIENQIFPNRFSFDDNTMQIKTSLNLDEVSNLYQASKEVQAQFNRITETILPIANDPNGNLKIVIYGSRTDYEIFHPFLTNLSSQNGGIYIEQTGTFYTYQRTPEESIYTLEELFRHEYAHYLVGRFLIEGFWGKNPIYNNNRLTWFDEGIAEFLTWSDQNGVNTRQVLVELIQQDGNNRLTVSDLFSATYSDFKFYSYAGLFFNYLYEHDLTTLKSIIQQLKNSDIQAFDNIIATLKLDEELNQNFQNYLDQQINQLDQLNNPNSLTVEYNNLDVDNVDTIQTHFRQTRLGYRANCGVSSYRQFSRFSCRGVLSSPADDSQQPNYIQTWSLFNNHLNTIIQEAQNQNINNFNSMLCRIGKIHFHNNRYATTDYHCDGPLPLTEQEEIDHLTQIRNDFEFTRAANVNCQETEDSNNLIECNTSVSSQLMPNSTPNSELETQLQNLKENIENQVYAANPNLYNDFHCTINEPPRIYYNNQEQKYMHTPMICFFRY